jgi:hypothetical protein
MSIKLTTGWWTVLASGALFTYPRPLARNIQSSAYIDGLKAMGAVWFPPIEDGWCRVTNNDREKHRPKGLKICRPGNDHWSDIPDYDYNDWLEGCEYIRPEVVAYPSVREQIARGDFENKLPYKTAKSDRAGWEAYQRETADIRQEFETACAREHGLLDHPKREKLFQRAWDDGHSAGWHGIVLCYEAIVELIK